MKVHLIKFIGSAEMDYHTSTYCKMHSDEWSEEFAENADKTLTRNRNETTCKRCINAYEKELSEMDMKPDLKYEDKPIYKVGEELFCKKEGKNVIIDEVNDGRDYSNQFRPDYKDGLIYSILIDGECKTGYKWWDFEPKK